MAYTINKTDGSILTVIADGTVDTTTNLILIGKNTPTYGDFLNENLVRLLEHAANNTPPPSPIDGQLWWDTSNLLLKVYDGSTFKTISASTASPTPPTTTVTGDLWWDTANDQLKIFNGTAYVTVGPTYSKHEGLSGALAGTIKDVHGSSHVVVNVMVQNSHIAVISKDDIYTPQTAIPGFGDIKPGINLVNPSVISSAALYGTASDASALGNVVAVNYARLDVPTTHTAPVFVSNNAGITVGSNNNYTQAILGGNAVTLTNTISDANIILQVTSNSTITNALTIDGRSSAITVATDPIAANGIATRNYVDNAVISSANDILGGVSLEYNTLNKLAIANSELRSDIDGLLTFKAPLNSPAFTGSPTAPSPEPSSSSSQIATTKFVSDLGSLKANLASPVFTGTPTAPTPTSGISNTQLSTTAFVQTEFASRRISGAGGIVGGGTLDNAVLTLSLAPTSNGFGTRTVSTSGPSGGKDGDIWYQV